MSKPNKRSKKTNVIKGLKECQNCGHPNDIDTRICDECGENEFFELPENPKINQIKATEVFELSTHSWEFHCTRSDDNSWIVNFQLDGKLSGQFSSPAKVERTQLIRFLFQLQEKIVLYEF